MERCLIRRSKPLKMNAREQGKLYFQKGKYSAAAEAYTEAITLEPTVASLYQNRALCYQKLNKWSDVLSDAEHALKLNEESGVCTVKALYLLGTANLNLNRFDLAEQCFSRAMTQSSSPEYASYRSSIEKGLNSVKTQRWENEKTSLEKEENEDQGILADMIAEASNLDGIGTLQCSSVDELLKRAGEQRKRPQIPECLCCQITFELMRDPVLTPAGQTFEREAIVCHLAQNGAWDPVTRQPMTAAQLVPNLALRQVIDDFMRRNPWAAG
mmetsp:Transcript_82087/g.220407  ORF Transcript_82087/g.220407 Transcript_82087/m.220407 type:complete len:270 (-) Transcript_82087:88-897(-)